MTSTFDNAQTILRNIRNDNNDKEIGVLSNFLDELHTLAHNVARNNKDITGDRIANKLTQEQLSELAKRDG